MFIVVFEVYVNYFILKFYQNEFDEKPFVEVTRNWINFRLRSFSYQGTLWQKIRLQFLISQFLLCGFLLYLLVYIPIFDARDLM